jgi:putative ABC transport system permease protein
VQLGHTPAEARRLAVAHFGGVERVREEHRDVRRLQWIEDFLADARYGVRALGRTPALAGAAVITIALAVGANVAIFSAVNAVVLQPLPFPHAERLFVITEENPEKHWHLNIAAPANILDWRAGVQDFDDVGAYLDGAATIALLGRGEPRALHLSLVTDGFFSTLGVRAALGRTFVRDASIGNGGREVVISDGLWRREFAADSSIVGKSVTLGTSGSGQPYQVVGVMPPGFSYPREDVDVWNLLQFPAAQRTDISFRRAHWLRAIARLKPGVTPEHADAELQSVVARLKRDYPETNRYMGALMSPLQSYLTRDTRLPLLILLASVGFLLLIACANVGNLLLVQAVGREREAALRLALGANRARLVRQALTESLVLSAIGGALGLLVGWVGTHALARTQPANWETDLQGMVRVAAFGIDTTVLLYVLAISVGSGLLFGVAPAIWARHRDPAASLKDGGRGSGGGRRARRWAQLLAVTEVALALLMATGAGLLARSFWRVRHVDPGFDPRGVVAIEFGVGGKTFSTPDRVQAFMRQLRSRVRSIPTVTDAAMSASLPLTGPAYTSDFTAAGRPAGGYGTEISHRVVSPEYFRTMRVRLLRGRLLTDDDRFGGPLVAVINDALARSYFAGENPVGQRITFDKIPTPTSNWYTIVGIVADEHVQSLDVSPRPESYHSLDQDPRSRVQFLVRAAGDPLAVVALVRAAIRELDPTNALVLVRTMDDVIAASTARIRFLTTLMLAFALIGVVLSVVGVYGVLAQAARNRTREVGVRIALGAGAAQVRWLLVGEGLRLTVAGLLLGAVVAFLSTPAMSRLLFEISPADPVTLVSVTALLAATSILAAFIPARRASRIDPTTALRAE